MSNIQAKAYFTKVKVARELLRDQAEVILQQYMENIKKMQDAGEYEAAAKALQWLLEHMPADEDGSRALDTSVDKKAEQAQNTNVPPPIQIGIQVGGLGKQIVTKKPKELPPAEVIDV